jgi:hypothetical protein
MARLLVFDSSAQTDANGNAVDMALSATEKESSAVLLSDERILGLEFVLEGAAGNVEVEWWVEQYSDVLTPVGTPPTNRWPLD